MPTNDTPAPREPRATWSTKDGRHCVHCGQGLLAHENQMWCPAPRVVGGEPQVCKCGHPRDAHGPDAEMHPDACARFGCGCFKFTAALPEGQEAPREEIKAAANREREAAFARGSGIDNHLPGVYASPEGRDTGDPAQDAATALWRAKNQLAGIVTRDVPQPDAIAIGIAEREIDRVLASALFSSSSPLPAGGAEPDDTARLNWLEKNRADIFTVCADEWDQNKAPDLMRYAVQVENWKLTGAADFTGPIGEGKTLREAIDAAMKSETQG